MSTKHKGWDINEHATGRFKDGKPIMGAFFQNGLNDIESDGSFVPCDMGIEESTDGVTYLKAKRGRWGQMRFGDSSHPNSFLVKIKNKGLKGVSFKYTGAVGSSMTANDGKPLCNFDNGISIESTPYYKGVKMDIIVNDPLTAPLEYPFSVKTYGQKYVFVEENGGATLRGEDQDPITIEPPYAVDADGDIGPVSIHYTGIVNNLITFKKVVDEAWLRQAAAPVRIDPNITIRDGVAGGVLEDAWLRSAFPDFNFGGTRNWGLNSGNETSPMKVDLSSLVGATPIASHFGVEITLNTVPGKTLSWYEVFADYVTGTATGGLQPGSCTWGTTGLVLWNTAGCRGAGVDRNAVADGSKVAVVSSDFQMPITNALAQIGINTGWLSIVIDDTGSAAGRTVMPSAQTIVKTPPYYYIEYEEGGGTRRKKVQMRQLRK